MLNWSPFLWCFNLVLAGSPAMVIASHDSSTRQCSLIRELVYQASQKAFAQMIDTEARGSHGKQTNGNWAFTNDVYGTKTPWPNSTKSRIMHYTEWLDTTETESWQYVTDFEQLPNALAAQRVYEQLNLQILGCPYQLTPDSLLYFEPLPLAKLPPTLPDGFEVASLYELPTASTNGVQGSLMLMVGMEKTQKGYRVSLMVNFSQTKPRTR